MDCAYKMDLVVEDSVVVEIKAIDELLPIHKAQLLTYLRASGKRTGLLINFNVVKLKDGLRRVLNGYSPSPCDLRVLRDSVVKSQPAPQETL